MNIAVDKYPQTNTVKILIHELVNKFAINKDNIKTQYYIKISKISINFSIDIQSSSVL